MILLLAACVLHRAPTVVVDPLAAPLAEADAQWARRAEEGGLDRALGAYQGLLSSADRRVYARISRAYWVVGMLAPEPGDAQDALETGRGYALECLLTYDSFASGVEAGAGRVTAASVSELDAEAVPCLAWGVANIVSLVHTRGRGASLELEGAWPLAERARALAPDGEMVAWGGGMLRALDATPRSSVERADAVAWARALLLEAVARDPDQLLLRVEAARALPELAGELLPLPTPGAEDAYGRENDEARRRAALLTHAAGDAP